MGRRTAESIRQTKGAHGQGSPCWHISTSAGNTLLQADASFLRMGIYHLADQPRHWSRTSCCHLFWTIHRRATQLHYSRKGVPGYCRSLSTMSTHASSSPHDGPHRSPQSQVLDGATRAQPTASPMGRDLIAFPIEIVYRPGKLAIMPDALSRRPTIIRPIDDKAQNFVQALPYFHRQSREYSMRRLPLRLRLHRRLTRQMQAR